MKVFYKQTWGYICSAEWYDKEASVVRKAWATRAEDIRGIDYLDFIWWWW